MLSCSLGVSGLESSLVARPIANARMAERGDVEAETPEGWCFGTALPVLILVHL